MLVVKNGEFYICNWRLSGQESAIWHSYWYLVVKNGNPIHVYWHLVVKNGNFHIATDN